MYSDVYDVLGNPSTVPTVAVGEEKHVAVCVSAGKMELWKNEVRQSVMEGDTLSLPQEVMKWNLKLIYHLRSFHCHSQSGWDSEWSVLLHT